MGAVMSESYGAQPPTGAGGEDGTGWNPPPMSPQMPPPMPPYPPQHEPQYEPQYPPYPYPPARSRRHPVRTLLAVLLAVVLALAAGIGIGHAYWRQSASPGPSAFPGNPLFPQPQPSGSSGSNGGSNSGSSGVAATVDPELVDIDTTLGYQDVQAAGTGIVLTSSGEVLTNNHVISGATTITATDVGNGRTYTATVVGYDRTLDVAVLKLQNASGLATATLGDSSKVAVGAQVTAIGNAGGVGYTPTAAAGSVTALNQSISANDQLSGTAEQLTGLIQVSADVQPGDSGGPLVDSSGKVVGVDVAGSEASGVQSSGGQTTAGFAIPVDAASTIAQQIEAGTTSSAVHVGPTAFLGVEIGSTGTGTGAGSGGSAGALVEGVIPSTPAAQAGLAQGDVITSFAGSSVSSSAALSALTAQQSPGNKVGIQWTDLTGATHSATVSLASGPAD